MHNKIRAKKSSKEYPEKKRLKVDANGQMNKSRSIN